MAATNVRKLQVCSVAGGENPRALWDSAFAEMQRRLGEYEAFSPTFQALYDEVQSRMPDPDAIDLSALNSTIGWRPRNNILHSMDLEKFEEGLRGGPDAETSSYVQRCREAIANIRDYRRQCAEAVQVEGYEAASDKDDDLANASHDATWALFRTPAPDLAALRWKIDHLFVTNQTEGECSPSWSGEVMAALMSDVARLLPAGA